MKNFLKNLWQKIVGKDTDVLPIGADENAQIKSVLKNIKGVIEAIKEARLDGEIKTGEWINISRSLLPFINNIRKWKEIKQSIISFDTEDGRELTAYCVELGFLKEDAEQVVIHAINIIEAEIRIYKSDVLPLINLIRG